MLVVRLGKPGCSVAQEEMLLLALVEAGLQAKILSRLLLLCFVLRIVPQIQSGFLQLYFEPQIKVQSLFELLQFYSISLYLKPYGLVQDFR
jgi:hypothetical protein